MEIKFSITENDYNHLYNHLFPGDKKEAVAFGICGYLKSGYIEVLTLFKIKLIPHDLCDRNEFKITWPTSEIFDLLGEANKKGLAIVKFHSHINVEDRFFSELDDISDKDILEVAYNWIDNQDLLHSSVILFNDGSLIGRSLNANCKFRPITIFKILGDSINYQKDSKTSQINQTYDQRTIQAFGEGTTNKLKNLKIGIVGCSGTGSPTVEQLYRLGVGELLLIDPDTIEEKNLNRILCSKRKHIGEYKTDVLKQEFEEIESSCKINSYPVNLYDNIDVIKDLCTCDVIFGCVDSVDGRNLINLIGTFFLIPIIDIGIKLSARYQTGEIENICFAINYLKPGQSLIQRGVYNHDDLAAATLFRKDKIEYDKRVEEKYIKGVNVDRPAVISINMMASANGVTELLARLHNFRYDHNDEYSVQRWELVNGIYFKEQSKENDPYLQKFIGRGTITPFLNLPELS